MRKFGLLALGATAMLGLVGCNPQMVCSTPICLTAHWPMDETAGTSVADVVTNPTYNVGTTQPGPIVLYPNAGGPAAFSGKSGGALYVYAMGSRYIQVPHTSDLNLSYNLLHIEAWVSPQFVPVPGHYVILDKWDASVLNGYRFYLEGDGSGMVKAVLQVGASIFYSSQVIPADFDPSTGTGTWTHVAVTLDGPFSSFKINGNPAGAFTAPSGVTSNSLAVRLGAPHTAISGSVPCGLLLDDVKIGQLNPAHSQQ